LRQPSVEAVVPPFLKSVIAPGRASPLPSYFCHARIVKLMSSLFPRFSFSFYCRHPFPSPFSQQAEEIFFYFPSGSPSRGFRVLPIDPLFPFTSYHFPNIDVPGRLSSRTILPAPPFLHFLHVCAFLKFLRKTPNRASAFFFLASSTSPDGVSLPRTGLPSSRNTGSLLPEQEFLFLLYLEISTTGHTDLNFLLPTRVSTFG